MDLKELAKFLVNAKRNTYASDAKPILKGTIRILNFKEGDLEYEDAYTGITEFEGVETVKYKEKLIWTMNYSGGMVYRKQDLLFAKETYNFLKKALSQVMEDQPFRGPDLYIEKDYTYIMEVKGDIAEFIGQEKILLGNKEVYRLSFSGKMFDKKI